jgi:flagellar protein FliO/FliZ
MNGTSAVTFILAFVFVLALIGLAAWLVRRFGGNRLGANSARGRMPRLAVIDAAAVDGRRRLVLVRRDNVEHLIMIGGPSDIVVEPNIVRAASGREREPANQREAARGPSFADAPSWAPPEPVDLGTEPEVAPEPAPPARPARPSFVEEPRRPAAAVLPERRPEPAAAVTLEPPRPEPRPEPAPAPQREAAPLRASRSETPRSEMPRSEPLIPRSENMMPRPMRADPPIRTMPPARPLERANVTAAPAAAAKPEAPAVATPPIVSTTPSTPAAISAADQNLADMAQRLEAALRRPSGEPARSEAPEPRIGAPSVAPDAPATASRSRAPEVSIAGASRAEAPAVTPPTKSGFENLEDEMASLLGRPKSSS